MSYRSTYKAPFKIGTAFSIIFFLFMLGFINPAFSQNSIYTIKNVKVDVTASDALKAREQAFGKAQRDAFSRLAQQLLSDEEFSSYNLPDANFISTLVRDFEVTQEQLSAVRYIGTYTFRFKAQEVKKLLSNQGVDYSDVTSKPVLIIPFYDTGSNQVLWDDSKNPFLKSWFRSENSPGLVPIIIPIGDISDVSAISDNEALNYSPAKLDRMISRYEAGDALIVTATPLAAEGANAAEAINIAIYDHTGSGPKLFKKLKVTNNGRELPELLDKAVKDVKSAIQKTWKKKTSVGNSQVSELTALVPIRRMNEWVETQKTLRNVQGVDRVDLLSLSPSAAAIKLVFRGSESRLRLALSQSDITLTTPNVRFGNNAQALEYSLYLSKYRP